MKVLVLNCGSSSIKYQFIDTTSKIALAKGMVERIGMTSAIEYVIAVLLSPNHGVIKDKKEIDAVGHRVVHGGETFSGSVLITDQVMSVLQDNIELAPLHNPPNIKGIQAVTRLLPGKPQVGVFDTSFHLNMPPKSFLYGIPYELY